jgi:peptidoglycan/LPS O-acetylase OafA/YrhL
MKRERALKVVLVLVGLFFLAGFYFLTTSLWHAKWHAEQSETEPMFLSVYITLGIFVLLAARNPSANRSLIAFTAWSSLAHAAVMVIMAFQIPSGRGDFLSAVALFGVIGVLLIVLAPAKQSERASAAALAHS